MTGLPPDAEPDDLFGRPPAGWGDLERLAADLWAGSDLADEFPRAVDRIAVMRLPLFLVDLPAVSVARVRRWLADHRLPDGLPADDSGRAAGDQPNDGSGPGDGGGPDGRGGRGVADRDLMGCLYAHGGHGYAFVSAADPPAERRLTAAHEVAHFLLDHLRPRRRVLAALGPAAADVLDGRRRATPAERAAAVLAHVRVGPHLHLLPGLRNGWDELPKVVVAAGGNPRSERQTRELPPAATSGLPSIAHFDPRHVVDPGHLVDPGHGRDASPEDATADDPVVAAAERRADALAVELVAPRARVAERLWVARGNAGDPGGRRLRIGVAPEDPNPFASPPSEDDTAAAVAAELSAYFELPPYALARYLRPPRGPRRSPLLDAARAAVDRRRWRRETDPS
jgi:hypothetical protein